MKNQNLYKMSCGVGFSSRSGSSQRLIPNLKPVVWIHGNWTENRNQPTSVFTIATQCLNFNFPFSFILFEFGILKTALSHGGQ
jgi:hypothetical protein